MGVRSRLLRDILSSLKYIKNLSEQQIRASLWRGEGMLYNIEFDPRRLQELLVDVCPVGLEILDVHVDELYVKIPWSQLGRQSVLVVARNVNVRFALRCDDEADWRETIGRMLRQERQKKQHVLHAAPGSLKDPAGTLNQLRQRMLHSTQMRADRVRVSVVSQHSRHHSAHRTKAPEGLEEALVVEFEDVFLTPCDSERVPSDQMKAMAVYEQHERVLQLTRLLKCRTFCVLPPGGPPQCPHAATEFMEAPGVLSCSIIDRSTSDGPCICPVLLSTELLFDVPSPLRIRCCECQLGAFLAMISDVGQLEEWRLDETLVTEREPELMNTSEVARTFAQGPGGPRQRQRDKLRPNSLIRATSAFGVSSIFSSGVSASSGSRKRQEVAPGFHPAEPSLPEAPEGSPAAAAPGAGRPELRAGSAQSADHTPESTLSLDLEKSAHEKPREPSGSPELPASEDPETEQLSDCFDDVEEEEEGEDPFCDAEELDYFSVASDMSPSPCNGDSPKRPADWLHVMRSWFGTQTPTPQCDEQPTVDFGTQSARIALSLDSLAVQVAVPQGEAAEAVEYEGERLSLCLEAKYAFTEAQRECVRRFAWPSEERPEPLWPWQLPRRISSTQLLTFHRFGLAFSGAEVLRSLRPEQAETEAMFVLHIRPRSAPPERLASAAGGELPAWPSQLRVANALLMAHVRGLAAIAGLYKRIKPSLVGKVPPPELLAPAGGQAQQPQGQQLFPAQCLTVEFRDCEFLEPGDGCIQAEQRWPWRGLVPSLVLRSDSALWDLVDVLGESRCELPRNTSCRRDAPADGTVSIPKELFDELVRRAAETTKKDSEVSAAREELQRAYIALATSRPHSSAQARARNPSPGDAHSSDGDQDELDQLRQKCLQLELSLQSQALAQRRLETELAHHQARAQEELRRLVLSRSQASPGLA